MEPFEISVSIEGLPDELKVVPLENAEEGQKYQIYNDSDYLGYGMAGMYRRRDVLVFQR